MKFIDSNVFIYAYSQCSYQEVCENIIRSEDLLTNTLVLIETFSMLTKITSLENAQLCVRSILKLGNIKIVSLDSTLLFESMKRLKQYSFTFSDLLHHTTAQLFACESIITFDQDFSSGSIPVELPTKE